MTSQFRRYLAEFLGTAILVFVGGAAILGGGGHVVVAFGFGLALLIALYSFGEVSGGHFNPAVTLGAFLDGRICLTDGINYWIAQVAGGITAALGLWWASSQEGAGVTATNPGVGVGNGSAFLLEAILTAVFVLTILKVTASAELKGGAFLAISLALTGIHMSALTITGASVNPARSIGPAVVGDNAENLWIYIVAPLVGAIIGWILYQLTTSETVEEKSETVEENTGVE